MTEVSETADNTAATQAPAVNQLASVDGWSITAPDMAATIAAVIASVRDAKPTAVFTLNLDHLVKLRRDETFRRAYRAASIVTADGAPIVWLARRQGANLQRTTGADLVVPLALEAARLRMPVALFGTSPDVLARACETLSTLSAGQLSVALAESPPMGFDPQGEEADAVLDRIVSSGAKLVFIALGAPKQEILAARAVARGLPVTMVCIGAGLDFIAGRQSRAPALLQAYGLEWAWRLVNDPRRMVKRYALCGLVLADLAVRAPRGPQHSRS